MMTRKQQQDWIERVRIYCLKHRQRLTPMRLAVLQTMLQQESALVKAYDVMAAMAKTQPCPAPSMYRCLDFFLRLGVLHRTEALHAYVLCPHFDTPHRCILFSCQHCGAIQEHQASALFEHLDALCASVAFQMQSEPLVLRGWCHSCQDAAQQAQEALLPHADGCCDKAL